LTGRAAAATAQALNQPLTEFPSHHASFLSGAGSVYSADEVNLAQERAMERWPADRRLVGRSALRGMVGRATRSSFSTGWGSRSPDL
jgi:hypothetical protein